jgi:FkbM family methyltransferase
MHQQPFGTFRPTFVESRMIALGRLLPDTRAGRRVASALRSVMSRIRHKPIDVEVLGQRMRLHATNNACEKKLLITPQYFDPEELMLLKSRMRPGFVFIDIGANVGAYSVFVGKQAGPSATVIAVEPNPAALERLRFNLRANGLTQVRVKEVAIADRDGDLEFAVEHHNIGRSSLKLDRDAKGGKSLIKVPARTLLGFIESEGLARIDAIKLDVEGYEDRILIPFFASAPERLYPQTIILEHSHEEWAEDCVAAVVAAGYTAEKLPGGNTILSRDPGIPIR